jgi:hypothetical protein
LPARSAPADRNLTEERKPFATPNNNLTEGNEANEGGQSDTNFDLHFLRLPSVKSIRDACTVPEAHRLSDEVIGGAIEVHRRKGPGLLVNDCLLVELKAVGVLHPSSKAQLFSCMKLLDVPIGLLINFHELERDLSNDPARR